jgi:redox-sensitive bicupin YhaK (pirin superfamily)
VWSGSATGEHDAPMSGPVSASDAQPDVAECGRPAGPTVEVVSSRTASVGGLEVRRALPRRQRRTIGAWCFADHFGPTGAGPGGGIRVGPHPHIGLQTVTWLVEGEVVHTDSLGSEQLVRPGQLNLMTAGRGVAHAEQTPSSYRGALHGVQLWVAQPDVTRYHDPSFAHHAELPVAEYGSCRATVLIGNLAGGRSPARRETGLLGVELAAAADRRAGEPAVIPLDRQFEHGLVVLAGEMAVGDDVVRPGALAYLGAGRDELAVGLAPGSRALLLGGRPFGEDLLMWWNFVARTRGEIEQAWTEWEHGTPRFGRVASELDRITAPRPRWLPAE